MDLQERIRQFIRHLGLTVSEFEGKVGLSNGSVSKMGDGTRRKTIDKISNSFPELSKVWLLTGEGEMLTSEAPEVEQTIQGNEDSEGKLIPLLPLSAEGGSLDGFDNLGVSLPDCEVIFSPIKDADMALTVSGKSMEPTYPEGCRVVVKRINHALFIEWGREYVLDTENGIVLKTLEPSDDPDFIRCISLNPDQRRYAPFEVPKESIRGVYRVHLMMSRK